MQKRSPHCALVGNCAHAPYEIPAVLHIGMLCVFTWEFLPFSCWIGLRWQSLGVLKLYLVKYNLVGIIELSLILVNFDSLVTDNAISKMNEWICSAEGNVRVAREQLPLICFLYKTHIFHGHAVRVLLAYGLLTKVEIFVQLPLCSFIEPCWLFRRSLPVTLHPPRIRRDQEESEGRFIGWGSHSPKWRLYTYP